jgi:hypothetical protein
MPRLTAWYLLVRGVVVNTKAGTATSARTASGVKATLSPQVVYTKTGKAAFAGASHGGSGLAYSYRLAGGAVARGAGRGTQRLIHFVEFFGNPAPPGFESITAPYVAPVGPGLRFIARNIIDGRVVDWDLPLRDPEITYALSGPTLIRASIEPENLAVVEERIDAWATWLHVELDGQIRASGIVGPIAIDGDQYSIEATGVAGYPNGIPFAGDLSVIQTDALDVVRAIWTHLLSYPDAAPLAVQVSTNKCGVLLGTPESTVPKLDEFGQPVYAPKDVPNKTADPRITAADAVVERVESGASTSGIVVFPDLTWPGSPPEVAANSAALLATYAADGGVYTFPAGLDDLVKWLKKYGTHKADAALRIVARYRSGTLTLGVNLYEDLTWPNGPQIVQIYNDDLIGTYQQVTHDHYDFPADLARITDWFDPTYQAVGTHTASVPAYDIVAAAPYQLTWWSDVDCGREIDSLAGDVPFDYVEAFAWNTDRTAVVHRIELGHPRAGRLRTDLRFAHGENLIEAFVVREVVDGYASQIVVRGKGEGRDAVRGYAGTRDARRVRRVVTVTDQTVGLTTRADAIAATELRKRTGQLTVGQVVIADTHPNAPIGSYAVGDDIIVDAPISYLGDVRLTHRITAFTWAPDAGTVSLELARSDSFVYGRGGVTSPGQETADTAAVRYDWGAPMSADDFGYAGAPTPTAWKLPPPGTPGQDGHGLRLPGLVTVGAGSMMLAGQSGGGGNSGWVRHVLDMRYGRWEMRLRTFVVGTTGSQFQPNFYLWPVTDSPATDGRYEMLHTGAPGTDTAVAYLYYPNGTPKLYEVASTSPVDMTQWHNFAFEWTPDHVRGYIDGNHWYTYTESGIANAPYPMHLVIELANFSGGNMRAAGIEVDWARVYAIAGVTQYA